jgi:hypothetical protein
MVIETDQPVGSDAVLAVADAAAVTGVRAVPAA